MSDEEIYAHDKKTWTIISKGGGKALNQKSKPIKDNKQYQPFEVSFRRSSVVMNLMVKKLLILHMQKY